MATSAGLLPYRRTDRGLEVLIAHPGGPFWAGKQDGAWSVVKGEYDGEDPLAAALREFTEETGWPAPDGALVALGTVTQRAGKQVTAWAVEAPGLNPEELQPGTFELRWRGRVQEFPEIDEVRWCSVDEASRLLNPAQVPLVERLAAALGE